MPFRLSDENLKRTMGELTSDLVQLFEAKYPRLYNYFRGLEEEKLIELMIEMCDIFDLYKELNSEVARRYKEHRMVSGSIEDRDWPEN